MAAYRMGTMCLSVLVIVIYVSGAEEAPKSARDFLKKEHSLMRPYTGKSMSLLCIVPVENCLPVLVVRLTNITVAHIYRLSVA